MSVYTSYELETDRHFSERAGEAIASLREMFAEIDNRTNEIQLNRDSSVPAMLEAVQSQPVMARALLETAREQDLIVSETSGLKELKSLSANHLDRVIQSAKGNLLIERASLLNRKICSALEEMRYEIAAPRRKKAARLQIQGEHEDGTAITVLIEASREIAEIDMSGFEPGVCLEANKRLVDQLKKRGVHLKARHSERHDNRCGGSLAQSSSVENDKEPSESANRRWTTPTRRRV